MYFVSFISKWLKDIVILFSIISIVELMMPKGNMKRYINMVIGLLVIFTIINPFIKLLNLNLNLDALVFNYSKSEELTNYDFSKMQEEQMEKIYINKLSAELKDLIEKETDYMVGEVLINLGDDGRMEKINISLGGNTKGNIHIERIRPIGNSQIKAEEGYKELKTLISSKYLLDMEKITIRDFEKREGK